MEASNDPKNFWKTNKVSKAPLNPNISKSEWHNHFKSLLFDENQNLYRENPENIVIDKTADILNEEITLDEIFISIKTLKAGKSAGLDSLSVDFFKSFTNFERYFIVFLIPAYVQRLLVSQYYAPYTMIQTISVTLH